MLGMQTQNKHYFYVMSLLKFGEILSIQRSNNIYDQRSKFRLSVRQGQPKELPDNQKYWCSCPTDNHKSVAKIHLYTCILVISIYSNKVKYNVNTKTLFQVWTTKTLLGRTTSNCNLVVRGTTIYFSLIRTLFVTEHIERYWSVVERFDFELCRCEVKIFPNMVIWSIDRFHIIWNLQNLPLRIWCKNIFIY